MKFGARNQIKAKVVSIRKGDIMGQVQYEVISAANLSSVLTVDSIDELQLKTGDEVTLIIKAVHVLPVKV